MSHVVKCKVNYSKLDVLASTIEAMGGKILGQGTHNLFSGQRETGWGFSLPSWRFPLVLRADSTLAFDDYRGAWGNTKDLEKLKAGYAIAVARQAAEQQGWYCELVAENLIIQMPGGETVTVTPQGVVDANGFVGSSCEITSIIENALGTVESRSCKTEFFQETAKIHLTE